MLKLAVLLCSYERFSIGKLNVNGLELCRQHMEFLMVFYHLFCRRARLLENWSVAMETVAGKSDELGE